MLWACAMLNYEESIVTVKCRIANMRRSRNLTCINIVSVMLDSLSC